MKILNLFIALIFIYVLTGCASSSYIEDEKEFSDMPWNTPKQWEGTRQMPGGLGGMSGRGGL
ncbi:MAG: hypothetical protein ACJ0BW_00165 [Pontiellaceae bacterium]